MKISIETVQRLWASGRNYTSLFLGFASGVGVISAAQDKGIQDALNEIATGVSQIYHGASSLWVILAAVAAPIIGPIVARFASNSAKVENQAATVKQIATTPTEPKALEAKAAALSIAADLQEVPKPIEVTDPKLAATAKSENVVLAK